MSGEVPTTDPAGPSCSTEADTRPPFMRSDQERLRDRWLALATAAVEDARSTLAIGSVEGSDPDGAPRVTLLWPVDRAFSGLGADEIERLSAADAVLEQMARRHVVVGPPVADRLADVKELTTVDGDVLHVSSVGLTVCIEGVLVTDVLPDQTDGATDVLVVDRLLAPGEPLA